MTRVVVAMSGGIDSSVAALELKDKGYEAVGVTIKTWPGPERGDSPGGTRDPADAIRSARGAAKDMGIPHRVIDLSKEFSEEVTDHFASEYARGRTPNPCVYCNSRIKFGHLYRRAAGMGADRIATGHYARLVRRGKEHYLAEARDLEKDQSYFLYGISREILPFIDFPLSEYTKDEVRTIAMERGITASARRESQDVCFADAPGDYRGYLVKTGLQAFSPGDILNVDGDVIGQHNGIASYTVGQRRGVGVAMGEPVYVLKISSRANTITVGRREHAMERRIRVSGLNWLVSDRPDGQGEFQVRVRYSGRKARAIVALHGESDAIVEFFEPQFALTPGQAAVFYDGSIVAGGGVIEEVLD
ncbi:MAG: tRNA 2-thiouridine(34) synthase MnmA [Candidatus Omnitrophica bacterium]|nr:tRNA 2-thiouridine(34) synthase MnmA [Candidatus Omnitrophota bacterium]